MVAPESAVVVAGVGAFFNILRFSIDLINLASNHGKEVDRVEKNKEKKTGDSDDTSHSDSSKRKSLMTRSDQELLESGGKQEENGKKAGFEFYIPYFSALLHLILFLYFLTATILTSSKSTTNSPEFVNAVYDSIPLGATTVGIFFGLILVLLDFQGSRFTSIQRTFYIMSALILVLGCISLLATTSSSPTSIDYVSLSLLVLYSILALIQSNFYPYPSSKPGTDGETKKAHLSMKAVLVILKPYFWPNATATSALTNRVRAILTWMCVAGSKACSLIAPLMLGRASTALSRFEYGLCAKYAIIYSAIMFCSTLLKEGQSLIYLKVAQAAFVQLSEVSFRHLHSLSLDWHLRKKLGEVIRSMDRGILACDTLMKYLFLFLVPAIAESILVCVIFAAYFNYLPLAVTIFTFVFVYIVWTIVVTIWRKKFRKDVAKSDNDWHDKCTDSLINFETVKYFTAEQYEMERFSDAVKKYQTGSVNVQASLSVLNISQMFLMQICLATALSLAAYGIKERIDCCISNGCENGNSQCCSELGSVCSGMEIGDFVAVLSYTMNLFMPLNFLGSVYNAVVMAMVDLRNLSELLAESPDVSDAPDAMELPSSNAEDPDVAVEFDNVIFHYPTQPDTKGLKGVSFKLMRGTTTAVVGTTGAGKTTVSRLLFRFYDVLGGAVKVNGKDVRTVTQKSLRNTIGVVPQATSMFNDTLKENIKYGKRDASDEELERVIKAAQLTTFTESLPEGWGTLVGDRGLKLSGGEKQRTAIARCLLKDPPFVVLDEATSALDTVTENSVQEALDSLGSERTCLVIAHRLGTIRNADNIIVLDDGVVFEQGTHDELLKLNGKYADMWNMQLHSTKSSSASLTELVALDA